MEETKDANMDPGPSPEVKEPVIDEFGMISTTEFKEPEAQEPEVQEPEPEKADDSEDAEQNTSDAEPKKRDFHEEPRFKELISEKNTYKAEMEKQAQVIEQLKADLESLKTQPKEDVFSLDNEEFMEKFAEDPISVLKSVTEYTERKTRETIARENLERQQSMTQKTQQERMLQTFNQFFDANPEAKKMWDGGEITAYMKDNPGHNAISAYREMTLDKIIKAEREAAEKEAREKLYKELKLKGNAGSKASSPAAPVLSDDDPEVKHPEKYGGKTAVILKKMMERFGDF